jgi:predicted kinase
LLRDGRRVIVDASFREQSRRAAFFELAARLCVPVVLLECQAPADVIRERLASRQGDASDADWSIYEAASRAWQPAADDTAKRQHVVPSGGRRETTTSLALAVLRQAGVTDASS